MFEHFGIMDVFSTVKKYIKVILAVIICFILIFSFLAILSIKSTGVKNYNAHGNIYSSSASYYIEPNIKPELTDSDIYTLDMYKGLPDQYSGILNNDFCKEYVVKDLLGTYSSKELVEKSSFSLDKSNNEIDISSFKDVVLIEKQKNSPLLIIKAETYDKDLSNNIIYAYKKYLSQELAPKTDWVKITFMGGYEEKVNTSTISTTNQTSFSKIVIKTIIKLVIIPVIAVSVLILIVVFFVALFNPTINRKSDFYEYEVPVISEMGRYKKNGGNMLRD